MQNISVVIFDLGRVLVHIDFDAFPNGLGLRTKAEREPYVNDKSIEKFAVKYETGKITTNEFLNTLEKIFQGKFSREHILHTWNEIIGRENQAILPIVYDVQRKYRTAVLSNTSESHWKKAISTAPVVRSFQQYFLSYEIGWMKPDPKIYDSVIESLRVPPGEILFIDDIQENIDAAVEKGMKGIVFTSADQLRRDLKGMISLPDRNDSEGKMKRSQK